MSSFWTNRTAFVTGATGFVGAHVVRRLLEHHARVVCLQRDATRSSSLDLLGLRDRVTVVSGAVEDDDTCARVLHEYEVDAVFHLAAQAVVGIANRNPMSTFESNIRGTYRLLDACRRSPSVTRVVVASSDKAYGAQAQLPYTEDMPLRAQFPYDVSKACADLIAQSYAHGFGLPVTITRSANIYGPADLHTSRIIPGTIIAALRGERPVIRSDGSPLRDFVYVDDVAAGYLLLAERIELSMGRAFNLGSGAPVSMRDLVTQILRLCDASATLTPHVLAAAPLPGEIQAQYLSAAEMHRQFGWSARTSLDAGLTETIAWYAQHGFANRPDGARAAEPTARHP